MAYQMTFKRYELKYLLNRQEKRADSFGYEASYEARQLRKNRHKKYLF